MITGAAGLVLAGLLGATDGSVPLQDTSKFEIAVLGHIRGGTDLGLHARLGELLDLVRLRDPDLIVLTGDIVWGDYHNADRAPGLLHAEWDAVDSALAALEAPVLRVPGNHDISDLVSRDVYRSRYGDPYQIRDTAGVRLILLNSAWVPEDGDTAHNKFIRGRPLEGRQRQWLRGVLEDPTSPSRRLVFIHHLLWWDPEDGPWWQDVHPLLAAHGVRAVVSGDYGPLKFSHLARDGIDYFQTSLGGDPSVRLLKFAESNRILAAQFDNFLYITVRPDDMDFEVVTLGEASSGHFTPARYRATFLEPGEPLPLGTRVWRLVGSPARLTAIVTLALVGFVVGVLVSRMLGGWKRKA